MPVICALLVSIVFYILKVSNAFILAMLWLSPADQALDTVYEC
jgi:hypothetical protein